MRNSALKSPTQNSDIENICNTKVYNQVSFNPRQSSDSKITFRASRARRTPSSRNNSGLYLHLTAA